MDASNLAPSAKSSPINKRGLIILAIDVVLLLLLLEFLPYDPKANAGLALMVFVGCVMADRSYSRDDNSIIYTYFSRCAWANEYQ
ncbi:Sodium:sulfate symporter-family protein [Proteus penneri]|nr:Sodium:sulfate symporter-family protein [Proteus penneri]